MHVNAAEIQTSVTHNLRERPFISMVKEKEKKYTPCCVYLWNTRGLTFDIVQRKNHGEITEYGDTIQNGSQGVSPTTASRLHCYSLKVFAVGESGVSDYLDLI